ncbi:hypothetical protein BIW11_00465 [Tropilaelaps mercedesae]|uniref:GRIP domain-containing protein n=1 Tax=Tropilaelaps mercedesae TaxID=418985 RepID=A0A1V9XUV2_9ACAR|nr:hypothetical protein BIW11_00465 [Tropilaelaps mercedesae]
MPWFNQINQLTSQLQNFAHDVFDQDGNYNPGPQSTQAADPVPAPETMETLRQDKIRLEESLLQLDQQYREEMNRLIFIKDDLQLRLKRSEAELSQYRKGITPTTPAADHEVNLSEEWRDDWDDGDVVDGAGGSGAKLDETTHELLELRMSLEEAQRQLDAAKTLRREFDKLKHDNEILKNRMEALEQENELLEIKLDTFGGDGGSKGDVLPGRATAADPAEEKSFQIDYAAFCKDVITALLGDCELTENTLAEARLGLQNLSDKVGEFERSADAVAKNVELIEDQKKAFLTEKMALEQELDRLRNVSKDLQKVQAQLKKATTDRDSLTAKLAKAKKSESTLKAQIAEFTAENRTTAAPNQEETQRLTATIDELEQKLTHEQGLVQAIQAELDTTKAETADKMGTLLNKLEAEESAAAKLQQCLTDTRTQLDVAVGREASLTQELQNVQALLVELQDESNSGRDEAAALLKKTREQDSELQQLRGELQLARVEETQRRQQIDELEQKVQALNSDQGTAEEMAALRQRLETGEQELELLRHGRDSVANELDAAKHELDICQQKLVQMQMESSQGHSTLAEQVTSYAEQLESVEAEKLVMAGRLAGAQQELEAMQVVRQALEAGMQQLTTEKEQMIAVVSDKARENADLKVRLDSLMGAVANEKQMVLQLQQQLKQAQMDVQRMQQMPAVPQIDTTPLQEKIAALEAEQQNLTRTIQHKGQENAELKQRIQKLLDNESRVNLDVQRLRAHLAGVDERHTKETLAHEHQIATLQQKLSELEVNARHTDSNAQAVTAAASERVEMLEAELTTVSSQRDEALEELSQLEDRLQQSQTSLASLQVVLEQMQRERDNQIRTAKKHHEAEQKRAQERISELQATVAAKEETLSNVAETVQATQRLSEQLEQKNAALSRLQQKLAEKDNQLQTALRKCREAEGAEGRVEKQLIKNMLLGYFTAAADKKNDVLRCITGYLEFNEEEARKAGLGAGQKGFFGIFGGGQPTAVSSSDPNESFTNQFIAFLEKESTPSAPLKLPTELGGAQRQDGRLRKVSSSSLPPDHLQQLPRQMTSSPFRPTPTDNPLFSHLPQQQNTVSSAGDNNSMATWAPSLTSSSRGSTASEPEMLRELLGQGPPSIRSQSSQ